MGGWQRGAILQKLVLALNGETGNRFQDNGANFAARNMCRGDEVVREMN